MMKMKIFLISICLMAITPISDAITVMSIDLSSEWMKIAIVKPGVPMEIVLNKETKRKTEVAVSMKDGVRLFGSPAVTQGVRFPKSTYFYLTDLLAKKMDNPLVQRYKERFPYYDLVEDPSTGYVQFMHDEEKKIIYSPEELVAMIFNYSRSLAEDFAQQAVDSCMITVPSYFNQAERMMVLYAAKLAGLPGPQLMDDNTASALNYGVFRRNNINATASYVMFYDMGATSTTATIVSYQVVKVNGIADPQLAVKGVGFDRTLGSFDMEFRIREHLVKLFNKNKKTKSDVTKNLRSMAKLLKEAGRLKKVLSANVEHHARVESLIDDEDFHSKVTREEFENLCSDMWPRVAVPIRTALKSAGLTIDMISKVVLVGGGTRVPKVQEILLKETGKESLGKSLNTDEAPALGASYEAAARSNGFRVKTFHIKSGSIYPIDIEFDRTTTLEDGSETTKHVRKTLFQRNNPYPQRKVITFNRFYSDFGFDVNYGDLKFLSEEQSKLFGTKNISSVKLEGVRAAHELYGGNNATESKGVKAHFRMDENGILNLEEVESLYESNTTSAEVDNTTEEDASAFQKLKDSFSSLFGGDAEGSPTDKEETGDEDKKESKEQEKNEEKTTETNDPSSKGEFANEDGKTDTKESDDKNSKESNDKSESEEMKKKETEEAKSTFENTTEEKASNTTKNGTETSKKVKKVKISAPVEKTISRNDFKGHSSDVFDASKEKLNELSATDALKAAREEAMNGLESYIYDKRDKLYQEQYEKALTSTEQEEITKALTEASDWLFDLEGDVAPEVYKEKLKELRQLARPWLLRVKEREEFPSLLKDMETMFNYTTHFVSAIDALPEDDQIYTEVEIKLIKKTLNDTITWKNETLALQNALDPSKENIMKPDDLKSKMGELNREVQYLLNKARTAKPKKKTEETKTNSTKAGADKNANTTDSTIDSEDVKKSSNETKTDEKSETEEEQKQTSEKVLENEKDKPLKEQEEVTKEKENIDEPQLEIPPNEDASKSTPKSTETHETTTNEREMKKEEL
ncbi:hypoxia up-regulated protein 1-like isoform X1 [Styela clava]